MPPYSVRALPVNNKNLTHAFWTVWMVKMVFLLCFPLVVSWVWKIGLSMPSYISTSLLYTNPPRNTQPHATRALSVGLLSTFHLTTHSKQKANSRSLANHVDSRCRRNHLPIQNPPSKLTQCRFYACTRISLLDGGVSFAWVFYYL